jgi:hypothetical protein
MNTGTLSVIGLLLVIFISMMMGNNGVVGYSSSNSLNEYPYEGFESVQNAFEARYAEAFEPNEEKKKYAEAFESSESPALKVTGFSGLQTGAYGNEKIIGFMYNNDSSTTCESFGYTNSKGNICLSNSDKKLLMSRGGNALGAADQIGK